MAVVDVKPRGDWAPPFWAVPGPPPHLPRLRSGDAWGSVVRVLVFSMLVPAQWVGIIPPASPATVGAMMLLGGYVVALMLGSCRFSALRRADLTVVLDILVITAVVLASGSLQSPFVYLYYLAVLEAATRLNPRQALAASMAVAASVIFLWMLTGHGRDAETAGVHLGTFIGGSFFLALFFGTLVQQSRATADLTRAYDTTIEGWSRALDLRDKDTEGHSQRVAETAVRLAQAIGVPEAELVHLRRGALLHDIGKVGIPDAILHKPGPLTEEEWEIMRRHPAYAYELLAPIPYLRPALDIPYCHHEKWDGTGYPRGLRGERIPLAARIFALVDVWDALRSDRPYRPAWGESAACEYVREQAGTRFDPRVVQAFLEMPGGTIDGTTVATPVAAAAAGAPGMATSVSRGRSERALPTTMGMVQRLLYLPHPFVLSTVLEDIVGQVRELFGYATCAVFLVDEGGRVLRRRAPGGLGPGSADGLSRQVGGSGIAGWVISRRQAYYARDLRQDLLWSENGSGARSKLVLPLTVDGRVIGVLDVESPEVDGFPEPVREALEVFATLAALTAHRARRESELHRLARTDEVTGLANRRALREALGEEAAAAVRWGYPVSLVLVELDQFKQVNDHYGHLRGDKILRDVAEFLRQQTRPADLAARFGGDEFVLLLPHTRKGAAAHTAEELRRRLAEARAQDGIRLTASLGIAGLPEDAAAADGLLEAADQAMYRAKRAGGNRVEMFSPGHRDEGVGRDHLLVR